MTFSLFWARIPDKLREYAIFSRLYLQSYNNLLSPFLFEGIMFLSQKRRTFAARIQRYEKKRRYIRTFFASADGGNRAGRESLQD